MESTEEALARSAEEAVARSQATFDLCREMYITGMDYVNSMHGGVSSKKKRKPAIVSGASAPPGGRTPRPTKSAPITSKSLAPANMAIATTPDQRITRLVAEGARILAVHPGQPGIDVTHDMIGLLELCHDASGNIECRSGPGEQRQRNAP